MKLLIAYDGSACSDSALDDLVRAGLPPVGEAMVIAVAEVWLPPPDSPAEMSDATDAFIEDILRKHRIKGEGLVRSAEIKAKSAAGRVRRILPRWIVNHKATYGSPAWDILTAAGEFAADLIVVGSHGRSAIGRLLLGSVSQKVMTEADCTVRIARGRVEVDPSPGRLVIGYDGSRGADASVELVAKRHWAAETEVRLISVTDSVTQSAIGRFEHPASGLAADGPGTEYAWLADLAYKASQKLTKAGLQTTVHYFEGNPNQIIVAESEAWHADCIFVGANTEGSRLARFLLGSTTSAVAVRAHCSVEIVRNKGKV